MTSDDLEQNSAFEAFYQGLAKSYWASQLAWCGIEVFLLPGEIDQNHIISAKIEISKAGIMNSKIKFTYKDGTTWTRFYNEVDNIYDNEVTYPNGEKVVFRVYVPEATPADFQQYVTLNVHKDLLDQYTHSWIEGMEFVIRASQDAPEEIAKLARRLPGVGEIVSHPVSGESDELYSIIMDLNDSCGWSREKIADFVDSLDIDTTFSTSVADQKKEREENPIVSIFSLGA